MAGGSSAALSRDIQTLFDDGTAVGLTDRQLLDRFAGRHDPPAEAAFEALVRRHGPMVLRVCRNALTDPNDAQDAFQATFLVLLRRSGALKGLESLGGWLYGVACRLSARARVETARRRAIEDRAAFRVVEAVEPAEADDLERQEFGPIVQEEVRRLPQRYRAVVVLCYWEGLTQEQAAAQLGCPLGTVRSRMARARDLLRRRLTQRGLTAIAVGMDVASGPLRGLRPLATELVQSTVRMAMRAAAGEAASPLVTGLVASMVQGIFWRTTMIKLGGIAAGVILVGLAGYGAGLAASGEADPAGAHTQAKSLPKREAPTPARRAVPVASKLEGQATIVKIVPNGSMVKKGDMICELDSRFLHDQLVSQRIAAKTAEAAFLNAKLTREVAEVAVRAYRDGDFTAQIMDAEGDIRIATAELELAELELKTAQAEPNSLPVTIKRAGLAVLRARFALEKAQSRKNVLKDYTSAKRIKELESAVKMANIDELVRMATWELEAARERKVEQQIVNLQIIAPTDGRLQYEQRGPNRIVREIGAGADVQPGQVLFLIEPRDDSTRSKDEPPASDGSPAE